MRLEAEIINPRLTKFSTKKNSVLSFVHFFDYIRKQKAQESTIKKNFFQFILDQADHHPEWLEDIEVDSSADKKLLYELVYAAVVPSISDEKSYLWGLGHPLSPTIFYGTDAFYSLLQKFFKAGAGRAERERLAEEERIDQWRYSHIYSFILNKVYGLSIPLHNEFTHSFVDEDTGLLKYITISIDMRFVTVLPVDTFPDIDLKKISGTMDGWYINYLHQKLPIDLFQFKGFTICTVNDSTALNVLENIRNAVADQNPKDQLGTVQKILTLLKSLVGNSNIHFGLLPILEINKHLVTFYESLPVSFLVKTSREQNIPEEVFVKYLQQFYDNPTLHFYNTNDDQSEDLPFDLILHQSNIQAMVIIPIFHNYDLVGIMEAHTNEIGALNESSLSLLEHALPLMAQLLQKSIHDLQSFIDFKIKTVFTSIQPSVEWKFKEAVWSFVKDINPEKSDASIPVIAFHNLYPLYGAIDIRNSTTERSKALQSDLIFQSHSVLQTLEKIKQHTTLEEIDDLITKSHDWCERIKRNMVNIDEAEFNDFVSSTVMPFLLRAPSSFPMMSSVVQNFQKSTDPLHGSFFLNRRSLETSMEKLIVVLSMHIDRFKSEIQKIYPVYFEKFRTDGIEYDLYLGQSIAPEKPFDYSYLNALRFMQLRSMTEIVRLTNALLPELKTPLQTTQLIFVNPSSIDISFRNDERRFDVEGAYNVRYQVIKKRIDKVNILNTKERLTQPGKIAIVYYNNLEAEEYKKYIHQLQKENLIEEYIEELELEELQGINGLKAMRVHVKLG
ncbi:MAG: GAF domain-containing protein [Chryseolinea sp.]